MPISVRAGVHILQEAKPQPSPGVRTKKRERGTSMISTVGQNGPAGETIPQRGL